jgi:hypothetical protein
VNLVLGRLTSRGRGYDPDRAARIVNAAIKGGHHRVARWLGSKRQNTASKHKKRNYTNADAEHSFLLDF